MFIGVRGLLYFGIGLFSCKDDGRRSGVGN